MFLSLLLALCFSCLCVLGYSDGRAPSKLEGELVYLAKPQRPLFPLNPFATKVDITFSPVPETNTLSKTLIAEFMGNGVAAAGIKEFSLDIDCDSGIEDVCKTGDALDDFVKLIDHGSDYLRSLKRVTWGYRRPMHPSLLNSLEKHFPNLDLDVRVAFGDLYSLRSSSLLRSLHLNIAPDVLATDKTSPLLAHIQTQIMNSKNLTKLIIEIGGAGCLMYTVDPKFSKPKGKRFPPLEVLSLERFPLSAANVDYWMTAMDWSQLQNLELRATREPTYFLNATLDSAGGLPGLQTIRIELPHFYSYDTKADEEAFRSTLLRFLSAPRPNGLSAVDMEGEYHPYLRMLLEKQGATLRGLHLHSPERYDEPQREMLSVQELRAIGLQAPNLEEIAVDINKLNGSLPEEVIDTLLSETLFPCLKTVELHGVLGVSNYRWHNNEELTNQIPLISRLASRNTIDHITIRVGEDRDLSGGLPASWVLWEQKNWELWKAERDPFGNIGVTVKKGWRPSRWFSL